MSAKTFRGVYLKKSAQSGIKPPKGERGNLKWEEVKVESKPIPAIPEGHALVQLHASALNHRDVFIRQGLYPRIIYDVILAADGAGVLVEGGPKELKGQRVLINSSINWDSNPLGPENPAKYEVLGLPRNGTLAEYIVIPSKNVFAMPKQLSFEEAAAIPLAGLTAWRATFSIGQVKKGDLVLVPGIGGGVAMFAAQFAMAAGAEVYVTSSSDEKIQKAIKLGACVGGVNYKNKGWAKELSTKVKGRMWDVVVDGAAGTDSLREYMALLKWGGVYVTYGATSDSFASILIPFLFQKQIKLCGSTMGSDREFKDMMVFIDKHQIKPVVSTVHQGLEKAEDAFVEMREGKQFGKIVVKINHNSNKL
ncbi:hypothetical protein SmJEL517_g04844 [Synchytrium microbalum]|uniref:Enoyl reductase (ER) domain-containing protein n=1 Tax=Synchytrium microbalum TaxID=1806994 RepID=A0A507C1I7_9FUNG|nr:uncharacterized protein SmJEL517_g04844 [Synchytrium microbalum]TPX31934.1 hypothetical protein SmJEL517_g04844 [Synchytrium microbalum]